MLITTTHREGFVAPENIVVYKILGEPEDSKITLDSELTKTPVIDNYENSCSVGAIMTFAYNDVLGFDLEENEHFFKAIIPRGTRFWLSDNLRAVVSEKLYVTSEVVRKIEKADLSSLYLPYCLDLLTNDGWRISWSPEVDPKDIRGIFVYESQAISLMISNGSYSDITKNLPNQIKYRNEAARDFSGRERTRYLRENQSGMDILKILPEDSYIPACGELSRALENFTLINLTRVALGLEVIENTWVWSSTPGENSQIWCVEPNRHGLERYSNLFTFHSKFLMFPFIDNVYVL